MKIKELLGRENKKNLVFLKCDEQKKAILKSDIDALLYIRYGAVDIKEDGECWFHYVNFEAKPDDLDFVRIYIDFYDDMSYDDVKDFFNEYEIFFQRIVDGLSGFNPDSLAKSIDMLTFLATEEKQNGNAN